MKRLDILVREYMNSLGASTVDNRYARFLQFAIEGVKQINGENKNVVKVARIPISETNFVFTLPADFIDYLRISVCWQGQLFALGLNDNICPPHFDSCGNIIVDGLEAQQPSNNVGWNGYGWGQQYNSDGFFIGKIYGIGGGQNCIGGYTVYKSQGYIAIQGMDNRFDEIVLQYMGDIDTIDEEHVVDSAYSEAIKAWIYWKSIQRLKSYGIAEKREAKNDYFNEKRKGSMIHKAFTITEMVSAVRSGYRSSPKI